jgi:hypothetical protein
MMPDDAAIVETIDESSLRHPLEMPIFIASVVLNFLLMAVAIILVFNTPTWIKTHPILGKEVSLLRFLAFTALVGIPLLVLRRNQREASIRGNSVRLSKDQFPAIYEVLRDHCRRLGMSDLPELFLIGSGIPPFSKTYSSWNEDYIILHATLLGADVQAALDIAAFTLAHELGAIRLRHNMVLNEMLLTYVSAIKWLRVPLNRVRTYSCDRYGATLSPTGFRGLLIHAAGLRLMDQVNIDEYLQQAVRYGGFWSHLNTFVEGEPEVLARLRQLKAAGFRYIPRSA